MTEFDPAVTRYNKAELRQIIHRERRIEFAGEGYYYNDIRRWKAVELFLNEPLKLMPAVR